MATITRTEKNIVRVLRKLPAAGKPSRTEVLAEMSEVQKNIAEEYYAMKLDTTIALVEGQKAYDVNGALWKIKEFIEPASWTRRLEVLHDSSLFAEKERDTGVQSYSQPLYAMVWNRVLKLTPAPVLDGEELEMLAYCRPSDDLQFGVDPEIKDEWDDALVLGTVARFTGSMDDKTRYEAEASGRMANGMKEAVAGVMRRKHSSDDLLF